MTLQKTNNSYYDSSYDTLNIFIEKSNQVYSEEIEDGIYLIFNEGDNKLVGIEIFDFSIRNIENLIEKLSIYKNPLIKEIIYLNKYVN